VHPAIFDMLTNGDLPDEAQEALAGEQQFREPLCLNPRLPEELWTLLWNSCSKSLTSAQALANRALSPAQRALVLSKEKRAKVLSSLLEHNEVSLEEAQRILALCPSSDVLHHLYLQESLGDEFIAEIAPQLPSLDRLDWLSRQNASSVSDEALVEALVTLPTWWTSGNRSQRSTLLKRIFAKRPAVLAPVLSALADDDDTGIKMAAAGCVHLSDPANQARVAGLDPSTLEPTAAFTGESMMYTHLALVNNPRAALGIINAVAAHSKNSEVASSITRRQKLGRPCVSEPFDQVTEEATLNWLVQRACSYSGQNARAPRPHELAALATSVHLGAEAALRIANDLTSWQCVEDLGQDEVNRLVALMKDHYANLADVDGVCEVDAQVSPSRTAAPTPPPSDEELARVATRPASVILSSTHYRRAAVALLTSVLRDRPNAWPLFAKMFEANPNMELTVLAETCANLSLAGV